MNNNSLKLLQLLFLSFFIPFTHAIELTGTVLGHNYLPIQNCEVFNTTTPTQKTLTDANGQFTLSTNIVSIKKIKGISQLQPQQIGQFLQITLLENQKISFTVQNIAGQIYAQHSTLLRSGSYQINPFKNLNLTPSLYVIQLSIGEQSSTFLIPITHHSKTDPLITTLNSTNILLKKAIQQQGTSIQFNCTGLPLTTYPAYANKSDMGKLNVPGYSKKTLKFIWDEIMKGYGANESFSTLAKRYIRVPSIVKPYDKGEYTPQFKDHMLKWFNYYRVICKIPTVAYSTEAQNITEHALVVKHVAPGGGAHYPTQVADMDDTFYKLGYSGSSTSNAWGGGGTSLNMWRYHSTVEFNYSEGKVPDNAKPTKIHAMGHRNWGLNPNMKTTGIGYLDINDKHGAYAYYKVLGTAIDLFKPQVIDFSAFPNGNYPIQTTMKKLSKKNTIADFMNRGDPQKYTVWTVQNFNKDKFNFPENGTDFTVTIRENNATGAIINQLTTKVGSEVINADGSYLRVKTGIGGHVTIKPKTGTLKNAWTGVLNTQKEIVFYITLTGVKTKAGVSVPLTYDIRYFDVEQVL